MFIIYAMVGAIGTAVQYAFLLCAVSWLHWLDPVRATVIGALLGAIVNYFLNARFTFRQAGGTHRTRFLKFAATALLGMAANGIIMQVLHRQLGVNYLVVQIAATGFVLILTYSINRVWAFRPDAEA